MLGFQIGRCYKRQLIIFPLHNVLNLYNLEYVLITSRIDTYLLTAPFAQFIAGILVGLFTYLFLYRKSFYSC